jgi:hypothetical protein
MWSVYLELLGIPLAIFLWLLYRAIIKKQKWNQLKHDVELGLFVCGVWGLVYYVLLR